MRDAIVKKGLRSALHIRHKTTSRNLLQSTSLNRIVGQTYAYRKIACCPQLAAGCLFICLQQVRIDNLPFLVLNISTRKNERAASCHNTHAGLGGVSCEYDGSLELN